MDEELVFKALADPSRRLLLDELFKQDGQTLSQLEALLPMTRFGAMKHLKLLAEANLITTEKRGREKYHFLNPIPIQQTYERWVSKFSQPIAASLTTLKHELELKMNDTITHRYQIFIQASPEIIWQAITDGTISPQYYFGTTITSEFEPEAPYTYTYPDGMLMIEGEILESDPPAKLVQTFRPKWDEGAVNLGQSVVTWLIEPAGAGSKLTLVHEQLKNVPYAQGIIEGWSRILSSMKTLLETGEPLKIS